MDRLVKKGYSTHEKNNMAVLKELMEKFLPAIMAIINNIEEVKEKVN
ncbi:MULTISPECIES: hypothetical protein [unclassified Wolbachia]|nr:MULTISPECIES: hypothetical protein [unclassified Wolbachia]QIT36283.1 hypothetical protein WBP_0057 [Wolbachia endosymbiont of Brugia pahangi]